jgi:hypothetical protein
MTDVL